MISRQSIGFSIFYYLKIEILILHNFWWLIFTFVIQVSLTSHGALFIEKLTS